MKTIYEMLGKANDIREKMQDDESKKLYDLKANAFIYGKNEEFLDELPFINADWKIGVIDHIFDVLSQINHIVICGAGKDGMRTYNILKHTKYKDHHIIFFDNSLKVRESLKESGFCAIDFNMLMRNYRDSIAIISSSKYRWELYDQMIISGFPSERIINPWGGRLVGISGNQYFDYFKSDSEKEIFVDAGCYDGSTSINFIKWSKGWEKIYAFEAHPGLTKICKYRFEEMGIMDKVDLFQKGTWSGKSTQLFREDEWGGSRITDNGNITIETVPIDDVVRGGATFIKMDVEGAENQSLLGASETIKKYKPKLAICLYHKPEDIIEIPYSILKMNPDYKLAIRHYTTYNCETILYAF